MHGLGRRLLNGTLATGVRQIINVCGHLVLVPVFLRYWGGQRYGEWQILSAAVAYMVLLDFGLATYVANRLTQAYSRADLETLNRLLASALTFSVTVCAAGTLIAVPVLLALPIDQWFQLRETPRAVAAGAAAVLALQTVWALPAGVVGALYRATGEYAREVNIVNARTLAGILLTAVFVMTGAGFLAIALMQLAVVAVTVLFTIADLRRRRPEVRIGFRGGEYRLAVSFLLPSSLFFLMQVSMALAVQGSTLVVGAVLGAGTVALFAAVRTMVNVIPQAATALESSLWPEFTSMEARGDYASLRLVHGLSTKVVTAVALAGAVFFHFVGPDLFGLWTSGRVGFDQLLLDGLLLWQVIEVSYVMSTVVLGSSNNHRGMAVRYAAASAAGLLAGYFLARLMGPSGVAFGLAAASLAVNSWWVPRSACKLMGRGFADFVTDVLLRGAAVAAPLFFVLWVVSGALAGEPALVRIAVGAALMGATAPVLTYCVWLNRSEREHLRSALPVAARATA
jgi:O-antigen/teichoic acid export membrane protein